MWQKLKIDCIDFAECVCIWKCERPSMLRNHTLNAWRLNLSQA